MGASVVGGPYIILQSRLSFFKCQVSVFAIFSARQDTISALVLSNNNSTLIIRQKKEALKYCIYRLLMVFSFLERKCHPPTRCIKKNY